MKPIGKNVCLQRVVHSLPIDWGRRPRSTPHALCRACCIHLQDNCCLAGHHNAGGFYWPVLSTGVQIGGVNVQRLEVRPDGTLRLLSGMGHSQPVSAQSQDSSIGTAGSSSVADFQSVPQIGALAGAGLSLKDGGQVGGQSSARSQTVAADHS